MKPDRRLFIAVSAVALATVFWLLLTIALIASTLEPAQREILATILTPRLALLGMTWLAGLTAVGAALHWLKTRYASPISRQVEQAQLLLAAAKAAPLPNEGSVETKALGAVIFQLAAQRDAWRTQATDQVAHASAGIQQENNRLAALMSELTQSVVVCNLDGRIILYNNRARLQFKTLSHAPALAGGSELVGIGRSIYTVLERQLVSHAMHTVQQRLARGAESPSTQFVTTSQGGQLLKVHMALVKDSNGTETASVVCGFILMIDNVTRAFEAESLRDQQLHGLGERSRSALTTAQAALAGLRAQGEVPEARQRRLDTIEETLGATGAHIAEITQIAGEGLKTRWPMDEMLGSDLLPSIQHRIHARGVSTVTLEDTDLAIWLKVDSYRLAQTLDYLAIRLQEEFDVALLTLRLARTDTHAHLDLVWRGQAINTETMMTWQIDPMRFGSESTPLTVRDVMARHGGELEFQRDRIRQETFFRFVLPLATVQEAENAPSLPLNGSRPEFYDFDLFQTTERTIAMDDRLLSSLSYTVFDTETTGLNPSLGDEIIQIGATRCVNAKLLRQECFDQLVNPGRLIPTATIAIHGISQDMVIGKPPISEVLPAFHAFALDTVLVAHNAAFDMRFLQIQEAKTGLEFKHPVLDTLLLSAVVHPHQTSHRLEAIAERFNITVTGRHTALGDALVTAEVWLRLIPLLAAMNIRTLGQAREAAQKTYYARLKY